MADERRKEDMTLANWMGRMEEKIDNLIERDKTRPCTVHAEKLAKLEVKAGIWGGVGGILAAVAMWLLRKI